MTGVLDRLERGGFVRRERDAADRRKVLVTPVPEAAARLAAHYAEHGAHTDALLGRRDTAQLRVVADFLRDLIASPGRMVSDAPHDGHLDRTALRRDDDRRRGGQRELTLGRAIRAAPVRAHPAQGPPVPTHERHVSMKARCTDTCAVPPWSAPYPARSASRWRSRASTG